MDYYNDDRYDDQNYKQDPVLDVKVDVYDDGNVIDTEVIYDRQDEIVIVEQDTYY
jgi:hypothetical protein